MIQGTKRIAGACVDGYQECVVAPAGHPMPADHLARLKKGECFLFGEVDRRRTRLRLVRLLPLFPSASRAQRILAVRRPRPLGLGDLRVAVAPSAQVAGRVHRPPAQRTQRPARGAQAEGFVGEPFNPFSVRPNSHRRLLFVLILLVVRIYHE